VRRGLYKRQVEGEAIVQNTHLNRFAFPKSYQLILGCILSLHTAFLYSFVTSERMW
jgi:hypothetical protein